MGVPADDARVAGGSDVVVFGSELLGAEAVRVLTALHETAGAQQRVQFNRTESLELTHDVVEHVHHLADHAARMRTAHRNDQRAAMRNQLDVYAMQQRLTLARRRCGSGGDAVATPDGLQPEVVEDVVGVVAPRLREVPVFCHLGAVTEHVHGEVTEEWRRYTARERDGVGELSLPGGGRRRPRRLVRLPDRQLTREQLQRAVAHRKTDAEVVQQRQQFVAHALVDVRPRGAQGVSLHEAVVVDAGVTEGDDGREDLGEPLGVEDDEVGHGRQLGEVEHVALRLEELQHGVQLRALHDALGARDLLHLRQTHGE